MKKLYGVTVAMVTPFTEDNQVDYDAITQLTKMLVNKGVNCVYPCGTTGEMMRLSVDERKKIAETVIKAVDGKITAYIHCGCMNQEDTITLVQHARDCGADGVGVVTPIFFGLNERELEEYYVTVANSVKDFPVYLYNIPQCSANDLPVSVVKKIVERCPNVIGLKYSWADINRTIDYLNVNDGDFSILHGCDRALVSMLALGCTGTVSGIAGVFPETFVATYKAYCDGDLKKAQQIQKISVKFCDALKCGSNMSYFKEGLKMRGIAGGHMRKPQLDIVNEEIVILKEELEKICFEAGISLTI